MTETGMIFNLVEGLTWIGIGSVILWRSRSCGRARTSTIVAGVSFVLFGVSDFIELRTGSWYQPVWLLVWNIACVASMVSSLVWHLAVRRKQD